jgi:hypothetical protein
MSIQINNNLSATTQRLKRKETQQIRLLSHLVKNMDGGNSATPGEGLSLLGQLVDGNILKAGGIAAPGEAH